MRNLAHKMNNDVVPLPGPEQYATVEENASSPIRHCRWKSGSTICYLS